jgi:hypothetical protein
MKKKFKFTTTASLALSVVMLLFTGAGCISLTGSEQQALYDIGNKLVEKLDELYAKKDKESLPGDAPVVIPENPEAGIHKDFPKLVWKYGGMYQYQVPKNVWYGTMKATKTKVTMDYTGAPSWFTKTGSDATCVVCVFYEDPANPGTFIGGKFDWISFSRKFRDLDHVYGPTPYNGWDPAWGAYVPAIVIIIDYKGDPGNWMIFYAK